MVYTSSSNCLLDWFDLKAQITVSLLSGWTIFLSIDRPWGQ